MRPARPFPLSRPVHSISHTVSSRIIQADEQIHLDTLPSVIPTLGGHTDDLGTCKLDFETAFTDVQAFVAPARTLEFVGTSASVPILPVRVSLWTMQA